MPDEQKDVAAERLRTRLKELREYLNLSQLFVAEQTGLSRTAIADIERGARKVDSLELQRFAKLYRHPVSYFLEDEPTSPQSDVAAAALARATSALTEEDKREVLRYAEFLRLYGANRERRPE